MNDEPGVTGYATWIHPASESEGVLFPSPGAEAANGPGKIALEEHFDFDATASASYGAFGGPDFQRQIKDLDRAAVLRK